MTLSAEYRPALTTTGINTRIELDGWAAGAPNTADANGAVWELQDVLGWYEAPGVRLSQQERPTEHGVFDGPTQLTERIVTITGSCRSPDFAASQRSRDILTSVLGNPALGLSTLVVYEEGRPTKQAAVRRADRALTRWLSDTFFEWSLILVAPDPRRYAAAASSDFVSLPGVGSGGLVYPLVYPLTYGTGSAGGELNLTNSGTMETPLTLTLRAPVTTPVITNMTTGQRLEFTSGFALATGQPDIVIDTDAKTVLQGSVNRRGSLAVAEWFSLEPGVSTRIRFSGASADPATARLTAAWRNAWT
jgi:tail protein